MIYLYEHGAGSLEALARLAIERNAAIVDTRSRILAHSARSWVKAAMVNAFQSRYVHAPDLLNDPCPPERAAWFKQIAHASDVFVIFTSKRGAKHVAAALEGLAAVGVVSWMEGHSGVDEALETPRFFSPKDATGYLNRHGVSITYNTVKYHLYVSKNLLPFTVTIGGHYWFTSEGLDEYIKHVKR